MTCLQLLTADDAFNVLHFELDNRAYFAESISDRGDAFYDGFADHLQGMLAEQAAGTSAFYVCTDELGEVIGRFNLYDISGGAARLGYRVARRVAGRGVATSGAGDLCRLAVEVYGLDTLTAATSYENVASRRVLTKVGFTPIGAADPAAIGGKQGTLYRRDLAAG